MNQELTKQKLDLVYLALTQKDRWYTGLSIKKYLRRHLFSLQKPEFNNPVIQSGRWSAYYHLDLDAAFDNLLDKNGVEPGQLILVHPLLPGHLIAKLVARNCKLVFTDISPDTWDWQPDQLASYLRLSRVTQAPDLVIHYVFNGLYQNTVQNIQKCQELTIPSLVFINNYHINNDLLDVCEALSQGSVLITAPQSFWLNQLSQVAREAKVSETGLIDDLKRHFPSNSFYSWHIENRTKSILEYHLSQSQGNLLSLIESYLYLLQKIPGQGGLTSRLLNIFNRYLISQNKFKSVDEAWQTLVSTLQSNYHLALPDLVIDLQEIEPLQPVWPTDEILDNEANIQLQIQNIIQVVNFIQQNFGLQASLPNFQLVPNYLYYFMLVDRKPEWIENLNQSGLVVFEMQPPHPLILSKKNLPVAQQIYQNGLIINLV